MTAERYRRLPGRRRGILSGASVWMGSDHLLAVRSMRFRENYKRFYLRDVQAIAIASKPRFHISMRSVSVGFSLLLVYLILRSQWDWADWAFWSLALCLAAAWALVSAVFSCTCRIYTAVSRDELPSVYRTWTARRFLARVEPLIVHAQGALAGDWTEVAEPKGVGPAHAPLPPPVQDVDPAEPAAPAAIPYPTQVVRVDKKAAYFFIAALFLDAGFSVITMHSESPTVFRTALALMLARVAAAILVFIQRFRQRLGRGIQRLAIVSLVSMGVLYYVQIISGQMAAAAAGGPFDPTFMTHRLPMLIQIDIAVNVALGLIGLAIVLRSEP